MSTILRLDRVTKAFGYTTVLNDVSALINAGDHMGIVGANGVGKSTLLKIIAGELRADSGEIAIAPAAQIGYLAQTLKTLNLTPQQAHSTSSLAPLQWRGDGGEVYARQIDDSEHNPRTVSDLIDEMLANICQLEMQMRTLEAQMATAVGNVLDDALAAYGEAASLYEAMGGYEIDARIDAVFTGLGLAHLARSRPLATLSGGEGTRAALALLLVRAPDVLLLDEPTNHLDSHALAWLETYLADYRGTALIVSHDREFLNKTVTVILEIDEHTRHAVRYTGNYDAYHAAKQQARQRWEDDYARQQEEIKTLRQEMKEGGHRNNNYRAHSDGDKLIRNAKIATHEATVSRRVRDAEARLARILSDPVPKPPQPLRFEAGAFSVSESQALLDNTVNLTPQQPHMTSSRTPLQRRGDGSEVRRMVRSDAGRIVIRAEGISKSYDGRIILHDFNLEVRHGARVAIVGANGAGKSTLLRILAGVEAPDGGSVRIAPSVRVGYMAQQDEDNVGTGQSEASLWDARSVPQSQPTLYEAFATGLNGTPKDLMNQLLWTGLFHYDDVQTRVSDLSAGQRRKLTLARLMVTQPDILLLDEPTNHLSFDVLEELEAALRAFPGTVIAASHDRRFLAGFGGERVVIGT